MASRSATYLHVFVTSEYEDRDGEKKTNYIKVGAAFPNSKGGFGIEIEDGISISGKAVALPPRENGKEKSES